MSVGEVEIMGVACVERCIGLLWLGEGGSLDRFALALAWGTGVGIGMGIMAFLKTARFCIA